MGFSSVCDYSSRFILDTRSGVLHESTCPLVEPGSADWRIFQAVTRGVGLAQSLVGADLCARCKPSLTDLEMADCT
jgi:hypothetical protein